jgi:hypothetical protein
MDQQWRGWQGRVRQSCVEKVQHPTREAAQAALNTVVARRRVSKPEVYGCELCDGWHWGTPGKKRQAMPRDAVQYVKPLIPGMPSAFRSYDGTSRSDEAGLNDAPATSEKQAGRRTEACPRHDDERSAVDEERHPHLLARLDVVRSQGPTRRRTPRCVVHEHRRRRHRPARQTALRRLRPEHRRRELT